MGNAPLRVVVFGIPIVVTLPIGLGALVLSSMILYTSSTSASVPLVSILLILLLLSVFEFVNIKFGFSPLRKFSGPTLLLLFSLFLCIDLVKSVSNACSCGGSWFLVLVLDTISESEKADMKAVSFLTFDLILLLRRAE